MFNHLFAISTNTFREVIRQPVYGIILLTAGAAIVFSPSIAMFSMMEDVKIVQDMGLATILLAGLFMAVFSASTALRKEVEHHTAATVLSKPVGRGTFLIAKYLGILCCLTVACGIWILLLSFAVRMKGTDEMAHSMDVPILLAESLPFLVAVFVALFLNYFQNKPFVSVAVLVGTFLYLFAFLVTGFIGRHGEFIPFGQNMSTGILMAGCLVFFAVTVLAALALALSTRLQVVSTILVCLGFLFAGLVSDYVFGRFVGEHGWARIAYALTPNLQAFWMADILAGGKAVPVPYLGWALGYAALYQMGILGLATLLFEQREVT